MFEWLGKGFRKSQEKIRRLLQREVDDLMGQDETLQQASSDSLRALLKTAIADAEEIVASIKVRAQTEAEAEATRIIAQAKLEIQEIKDKAEIAAQKQAEDILSAASRKAEITEVEAKQKALQFLIRASEALLSTSEAVAPPIETLAAVETELKPDIVGRQKVEEPVQLQEEALEEKVEEPVQLQEEALEEKVEEPVQLQEEALEEELEERGDKGEPRPAPPKLDSQAVYSGEVELIMASPVELKLVSRLYNYLQTVPELRILYTRGSWDQGTTITVVLDKPMPLIGLISETPGVEVIPELLEKDSVVTGKSGPLSRGAERGVLSIKLNLKEA